MLIKSPQDNTASSKCGDTIKTFFNSINIGNSTKYNTIDYEYRNRKVASTLMLCFLREAVKQGVHWSTLEVSEINEHAIKLYTRFGYKTVSVRKKYYGENEDAFLMWLGNMHLKSFSERLDVIEQEIS